jgi:hypothetical protein
VIPAAIQKVAAKRLGAVGRATDSTGKHVAFWYEAPNSNGWRVYRATVAGMLSVLRSAPRHASS